LLPKKEKKDPTDTRINNKTKKEDRAKKPFGEWVISQEKEKKRRRNQNSIKQKSFQKQGTMERIGCERITPQFIQMGEGKKKSTFCDNSKISKKLRPTNQLERKGIKKKMALWRKKDIHSQHLAVLLLDEGKGVTIAHPHLTRERGESREERGGVQRALPIRVPGPKRGDISILGGEGRGINGV